MVLFNNRPVLSSLFFGALMISLAAFCLSAVMSVLQVIYNCTLFGWKMLIHPWFLYTYYCQIGVDLVTVILMIKKKSLRLFLPVLFVWVMTRYGSYPSSGTFYSEFNFFVWHFSRSIQDTLSVALFCSGVVIWFALILSLVTLLKRTFSQKNTPPLKRPTPLPAPVPAKATNVPAPRGKFREFLLVLIGLLLTLSSVSLLNHFLPRYFSFHISPDILTGAFYYINAAILPTFFQLFAVYLIYKKWKPLSYCLPFLTFHLIYRGFFKDYFPAFSFPHDSTQAYFAALIGKPINQALVGLILLNTLLLPLDWVQAFQRKRHRHLNPN